MHARWEILVSRMGERGAYRDTKRRVGRLWTLWLAVTIVRLNYLQYANLSMGAAGGVWNGRAEGLPPPTPPRKRGHSRPGLVPGGCSSQDTCGHPLHDTKELLCCPRVTLRCPRREGQNSTQARTREKPNLRRTKKKQGTTKKQTTGIQRRDARGKSSWVSRRKKNDA